jgi:hypothetical protein
MAEIVHLKSVRKARDAAEKKAAADANAAKFGRTKALKALEQARAEKALRDLDALKRE